MADLGLSGLASNFDWHALIDQLTEVERTPQTRMRSEQSLLQQRSTAYSSIKTQLDTLKTRIDVLKDPLLFDTQLATSEDSTVATASASGGAGVGIYAFSFSQLATASVQQGSLNVGKALSGTNDVSTLVLNNAGFSTSLTAGTFMVSGKQVTLDPSDTLQQLFDKISTATSGTVAGSYNATTDKISLTSSSPPIILGSASDTSNFLQVSKLNNNGTGNISSSSTLGAVGLSLPLAKANLQMSISGGGSGAGEFKINGVSFGFNLSTDSVSVVLARINNSAAGVTANYDSVNDRFTLTDKTTGDMGIAMEDVTGNFLAATNLSSGSLQRGKNLHYTINGGSELLSQSNTISEATSGLAGLSVMALKEGSSTTITLSSDSAKIKTAIGDFISEYNKTQALIDAQTASSTDAKGKVTAGLLASDLDASDISFKLRSMVNGDISGLAGTLKRLEAIGYVSNGNDDSLILGDSAKLESVLANNLNDVKTFFTDSAIGIAVGLSDYLEKTVGDAGTLLAHQDSLTKLISSIDTQVSDQERLVQSNRQRLTDSFVAMETAQAKINQQLAFLTKNFP